MPISRTGACLWSASLALLLAFGCSGKSSDDSSDGNGSAGTGGGTVQLPDSGTPTQNGGGAGGPPAPACQTLEGLGECGGTSVEANFKRVNILLVIDKSGSMTDQPSGFDVDKWNALQQALETALSNVAADINFGLVLYPFSVVQQIPLDCRTGCCEVPTGPLAVNVPVGPGIETVPQILQALADTSPGGGTPTAAALQGANEYFTTGAGALLEGDKYVLLATDGGPNCNAANTCDGTTCTPNLDGQCSSANCCKDAGDYCLDDQAVTDRISELASGGIPTFVVGIPGTEAYAPYLDQFALAGGVPSPSSPPDYYAVSADLGVTGLVDVFTSITTQLVRSCEVELAAEPPKLDEVNVAVDCEVVRPMADDGSGWEVDTSVLPNVVVLKGPLCDRVQQTGARRVDVVYGCPTIR